MTRQLTSRDKQENLELKGSELQQTKLVIYLSLESMAMSSDQCDSVFLSVDSLLNDALQMQRQCRDRSDQLSQKAIELQNESATLRETSKPKNSENICRLNELLSSLDIPIINMAFFLIICRI
uniref:Uncharacterized protein n=1 Tax=Knipowitschia caucasica TaxID=637954 RepID=A0AAV2KIL0_KNICA